MPTEPGSYRLANFAGRVQLECGLGKGWIHLFSSKPVEATGIRTRGRILRYTSCHVVEVVSCGNPRTPVSCKSFRFLRRMSLDIKENVRSPQLLRPVVATAISEIVLACTSLPHLGVSIELRGGDNLDCLKLKPRQVPLDLARDTRGNFRILIDLGYIREQDLNVALAAQRGYESIALEENLQRADVPVVARIGDIVEDPKGRIVVAGGRA